MNYEKIGKFIADKRKEKNMTQTDLAKCLGITNKAVSKWERGLGCPDVSLLEILSDVLDVSILEILKGREIENEVISVTEADDYIKNTAFNEKKKGKKIVLNILTIIIIVLSVLCVYFNISNMIYLNIKNIYILTDTYVDESKNQLKQIKNNIDIIKNNQGNFDKKDYDMLINDITSSYNTLSNLEIFKVYNNKKVKLKDIDKYVFVYREHDIYEAYQILEKYDSSMNLYVNSYLNNFKLLARAELMIYEKIETSYQYKNYTFRDFDRFNMVEYFIEKAEADVSQLNYLTYQIMKVGDIHE